MERTYHRGRETSRLLLNYLNGRIVCTGNLTNDTDAASKTSKACRHKDLDEVWRHVLDPDRLLCIADDLDAMSAVNAAVALAEIDASNSIGSFPNLGFSRGPGRSLALAVDR